MSTSADSAAPMSAASTRGALPRRRFFDDMPDRGLFALVAVLGFASIMGLKYYAFNPDAVAAFAVLLMLAYGVIAYQIPAVNLRADRLGDNFYYLGFIYTLASMSAALLQLRQGADLEPLLGSFGIALITTIVGVAGRVMFVQMRGEIDEIEEQVRRDLLATSSDLKAQLALALREFETFSTAVRQTANETASQSTEAAQKQIELIGSVARGAADEIKTAFEANRSSLRELTATAKEISKAFEQASERLSAMELPTRRFEQQLDSFGAQLLVLLTQLAAAIETTKRVRRRWYWPFGRRSGGK